MSGWRYLVAIIWRRRIAYGSVGCRSEFQVFESVWEVEDFVFQLRQIDVLHRWNCFRTGSAGDSRFSFADLALLFNSRENFVHVRLNNHSALNDLIHDEMNHVAVENEIQLADIWEGTIKSFNKDLNEIQDSKFTFWFVTTENKIERSIMTIDQLAIRCSIH